MRILFHGWHSVPGGVKPSYLAQHGHEVINPELPDDDFAGAVRIAQAEFDKNQPQAVVGSSRGGAVAMNINGGTAWLVLLCPAWRKHGTARTVKPGTVILHARADDVVPFADSGELVRNSGLPASALVEVGDDHRLADPTPRSCWSGSEKKVATSTAGPRRGWRAGSVRPCCGTSSRHRRRPASDLSAECGEPAGRVRPAVAGRCEKIGRSLRQCPLQA
jgi:hypothetical protein